MILENVKTGAWIPVASEAAGRKAARHMGWVDFILIPEGAA